MSNDTKINSLVDGVRSRVRSIYWKAVNSPLGKYVPTPQIIGAAVAAVVANVIASQVPGFTPPVGLLETGAALVVGYLIGPPINPADTVDVAAVLVLDDQEPVEPPPVGFTEPPVSGEWVGEDPDDPNPPGQVV